MISRPFKTASILFSLSIVLLGCDGSSRQDGVDSGQSDNSREPINELGTGQRLSSMAERYPSGKLKYQINAYLEKGRRIDEVLGWYEDGKKESHTVRNDGLSKLIRMWYKSGSRMLEIKADAPPSAYRLSEWYLNGSLRFQGKLNSAYKLHGKGVLWHQDGRKWLEVEFSNGVASKKPKHLTNYREHLWIDTIERLLAARVKAPTLPKVPKDTASPKRVRQTPKGVHRTPTAESADSYEQEEQRK